MALHAPSWPPFEHVISRDQLQNYSEIMDRNAKENWRLMGYPEHMRKWKRPEV